MAQKSREERDDPFFDEADPQLDPEAVEILTEYSGIIEEEVPRVVKSIRDKAWVRHQYPCIGLYKFVDFTIANHPNYTEVLARTQTGETFLDVGCCFGHAIRKLIFDGAPAENLYGFELEPDFVDLGFELFRDRETLQSQIWIGDIFTPSATGLQGQTFDIIHAGAFLHLFTWDEQKDVFCNIVRLLKPKAGSMIFGRQSGADVPGDKDLALARSGKIYRHNPVTFKSLVADVSATVDVHLETLVEPLGSISKLRDDGSNWKLLSFCIVFKDV